MVNTVFLFEKSNKEILIKPFYDREREDYSYQETLPYELLGGDGFERLCYLILLNENQRCIPHFFGRKGQADYGVDQTLQDEKGGFSVYQCKNWNRKEELSVKAFEDIFNDFNKRWVGEQGLPKPGRFILCTSMIIDKDKSTHEAFMNAKAVFEKRYLDQWGQSILVEFCDRTALDNKLKKLPDIVVDMFSSGIAERHCEFVGWNSGIFIPVNESSRNHLFLKEFFKRQDKIYIPEEWSVDFFEKIREHKKVLIKGFPGSGKTTISLALSRKFFFGGRDTGKQCYVYYVTFKTQPSLEELRKGIYRRSFLPSVFIFDDCQRETESFKSFCQSILDMFEGKNIFCIFLYRTTLIEGKESVDDSELEELFEKKTLKIDVSPRMFKEIVEMVKPGLRYIDIDELYDFTGHDLFILDFVLQSIDSPGDFEKIKADREELYKEVVKKYFFTDTDRYKSVLKIASLAQFDIGINLDYFENVIRCVDKEREKVLRGFVAKAERPSKYFFLHTSHAELICRAAFYMSGSERGFVKEVAANAVEYFKFLSTAGASGEEFNRDLYNFLFNSLKLYRDPEESEIIKLDFLNSEEIIQFVKEKFELIYPNLIGKIVMLTGSNGDSNSYYNILKEKVEDGSYIDVLVSGDIGIGNFLYVIGDSYPGLFKQLKNQFDGDKLKRLCEGGYFQSLIRLLSSFFKKDDKEHWDILLDVLDNGSIDSVIERTIDRDRTIGTIHMGFRELRANGLLGRLEQKVGAFNYLRLIENNGTFTELINVLRYSTESMANALIDLLTDELSCKLIDKTIAKERSIGTIGLGLRELKEKDLLSRLEGKIGVSNYLRLIENNGTFIELIRFIPYSTNDMANALIELLTEELACKLIEKTIAKESSIGTIGLGLRELKEKDLLSKFEKKIGPANYLRLIENNGTFVELIRFIPYSTNDMANALIELLTEELACKLIDKTIAKESSIGTIGLGLRELKEKDLLSKFEKKIGPANYLRLIEDNGTFVELIRFIPYSTNDMANALIELLTEELACKLIDKSIAEGSSIGTIGLGLRELKEKGLLSKFEGKIGGSNYLRLIENNGTFIELIRFIQNSTNDMANALMRRISADWMSKLIDKTIDQKRSINRIHWDIKALKGLCSRLNLDFEEKIGTGNIIKLIIFNGNPGLIPNVLETFSENQKNKLLDTFNSLTENEKDDFILRGNINSLCYGLINCPQLSIFSSFNKVYPEKKALMIKKLVEKSSFKDMNRGIGYLNNSPNEELKSMLLETITVCIDKLNREHIQFESHGEKISFLSILHRLEKLDRHTIENILNTIDENKFSGEKDFVFSLRMLQILLCIYEVEPRWRQKILDFSNSDKTVKALKKGDLLAAFLYLWNTYALSRMENPGHFNRWVNPGIVSALIKTIEKNVRAKQGTKEYRQLLMLVGLLDYFHIESDRIREIFPLLYHVNLGKFFLNQELENLTFIPGFFYLKGVEFFIKGPVFPNIWKKLCPKIDDYGDIRSKALQEIIEIVQNLCAGH